VATRESARERGIRRAAYLLRRIGEDLRRARTAAGLSARLVAATAGISHGHLRQIERGLARHVEVDVLARIASVVGMELNLSAFPVASPLRDRAHLALLERLRARLHASWRWLSEVVMPIPGDRRSADATIENEQCDAMIECETHLDDIQALEREISAKARDLGCRRVIVLVLDSRHNRAVIRSTPELQRRFPIGTRAALGALARGDDPGGDCLIVL
jgi:transcriptional regulator with XRE-family HTH domain